MIVNGPKNNGDVIYTPASLVTVFAKLLRYAQEEREQLLLRGVYVSTGMKRYGGVFYDQLQEETTEHTLTIKVPERLRMDLESGDVYVFLGALERGLRKDGTISLCFVVTGVQGKEERVHSEEMEERFALLQQKLDKGMVDVEHRFKSVLAHGALPRIAMVYGEQGIVDKDVHAALRDGERYYEFVEFRVNMSKREEIMDVLQEIGEGTYDGYSLIRGGGSGLEVFSDPVLVQAALDVPVPLLTALGHAEDRMLLEKVADKVFATPTALGVFLRELAEEVVMEREHSRTFLLEELQKQFQTQREQERAVYEKEKALMLQESRQLVEVLQSRQKYLYYGLGVLLLLVLILSIALLLG